MGRILTIFIASLAWLFSATAKGAPAGHFLHDLSELPQGLALPVTDEMRHVAMPPGLLRIRASADPATTIDPVVLVLPQQSAARAAYVRRFAAPGKARELMRIVEARKTRAGGDRHPRLRVDEETGRLFDLKRLGSYLGTDHHHLTLAGAAIRRDPALRDALLAQASLFLSGEAMQNLAANISRGEAIDVDTGVLPTFAAERVGKFSPLRGPNCFRAALAFQDPALPRSPAVNRNAEAGFSPEMINNDELWFALSQDFIEVDTTRESLRYGDVIVFFDGADAARPMDFHWLKHAATYLFGGYVFSKASYAADSAYTVKTLGNEWSTWQKRATTFGAKVYRRR